MKQNYGFHLQNSYAELPEILYTPLAPTPVSDPNIIIINHTLATELGLNFACDTPKELAELFSGNTLPQDAKPLAQAYAGHQFGHFAILGDGRAHLIAEHLTPLGQLVDIQLKGSGPTPYSRRGDGRAALGPMLREYIISEAMHELGIATTRSLAVVSTGERVYRTTLIPGAILTRVAASHLRVGTFEFAAFRKDIQLVTKLLDYSIQRHYPELVHSTNKALDFFACVMERQINLVVNWLRVGFIHGVMNTDNMTISGESIDYGPCAFMDEYDPNTVFSSIDEAGRYAYNNQAAITQWNLVRLIETLLPLISDDKNEAIELAKAALNQFLPSFQEKWLNMMRNKLGLLGTDVADLELIQTLLNWMHTTESDYTNTFLQLSEMVCPSWLEKEGTVANQSLKENNEFMEWYMKWQLRLSLHPQKMEEIRMIMKKNNPAVIPRNHMVEQAINAAYQGNMDPFEALLMALRDPYQNRIALAPYQTTAGRNERVYNTYCGT